MKSKRILIVASSSFVSGVETHTYDLIYHLKKYYKHYEIFALAPTGGPWVDRVRALGIKVIIFDFYKHYFRRLLGLFKIFRNYKFDIVHNHAFTRIALVAAKLAGCKFTISSVHVGGMGEKLLSNASRFRLTDKFVDLFVDRYIANSQMVYNELLDRKIDKHKISIVYYGLKANFFVSKVDKKNNGVFTIGTLGRLEEQKSIDVLLKALEGIKEFRFVCKIGGDGSLYNYLSELAKKLNIDDKVEFCGTVEPVNFLDTLDLFILSSRFESFGLVLLEAAARKLPIIVSDLAVVKELRKYFIPNLEIFSIGDYGQLTEEIKKVYFNYRYYLKKAEKNYEFAKSATIANMVRQITDIYEEN